MIQPISSAGLALRPLLSSAMKLTCQYLAAVPPEPEADRLCARNIVVVGADQQLPALQVAPDSAGPQATADLFQQFVRRDGLAQEAGTAVLGSPFPRQDGGGDDHDPSRAPSRRSLQSLEQVPAVQDGHEHIQHDEVRGRVVMQIVQGLRASAPLATGTTA
jgi:hypothetical protein